MHKAIQLAKKCQSNWINYDDIQRILSENDKILLMNDTNERAYKIFEPLDKKTSKTITAQWFSKLLKMTRKHSRKLIRNDKYIKYVIDAINHVTG